MEGRLKTMSNPSSSMPSFFKIDKSMSSPLSPANSQGQKLPNISEGGDDFQKMMTPQKRRAPTKKASSTTEPERKSIYDHSNENKKANTSPVKSNRQGEKTSIVRNEQTPVRNEQTPVPAEGKTPQRGSGKKTSQKRSPTFLKEDEQESAKKMSYHVIDSLIQLPEATLEKIEKPANPKQWIFPSQEEGGIENTKAQGIQTLSGAMKKAFPTETKLKKSAMPKGQAQMKTSSSKLKTPEGETKSQGAPSTAKLPNTPEGKVSNTASENRQPKSLPTTKSSQELPPVAQETRGTARLASGTTEKPIQEAPPSKAPVVTRSVRDDVQPKGDSLTTNDSELTTKPEVHGSREVKPSGEERVTSNDSELTTKPEVHGSREVKPSGEERVTTNDSELTTKPEVHVSREVKPSREERVTTYQKGDVAPKEVRVSKNIEKVGTEAKTELPKGTRQTKGDPLTTVRRDDTAPDSGKIVTHGKTTEPIADSDSSLVPTQENKTSPGDVSKATLIERQPTTDSSRTVKDTGQEPPKASGELQRREAPKGQEHAPTTEKADSPAPREKVSELRGETPREVRSETKVNTSSEKTREVLKPTQGRETLKTDSKNLPEVKASSKQETLHDSPKEVRPSQETKVAPEARSEVRQAASEKVAPEARVPVESENVEIGERPQARQETPRASRGEQNTSSRETSKVRRDTSPVNERSDSTRVVPHSEKEVRNLSQEDRGTESNKSAEHPEERREVRKESPSVGEHVKTTRGDRAPSGEVVAERTESHVDTPKEHREVPEKLQSTSRE
ncbi:MAG: hypothetical protein ACI9S8_002655, partial [Chlamydiales bacterium]